MRCTRCSIRTALPSWRTARPPAREGGVPRTDETPVLARSAREPGAPLAAVASTGRQARSFGPRHGSRGGRNRDRATLPLRRSRIPSRRLARPHRSHAGVGGSNARRGAGRGRSGPTAAGYRSHCTSSPMTVASSEIARRTRRTSCSPSASSSSFAGWRPRERRSPGSRCPIDAHRAGGCSCGEMPIRQCMPVRTGENGAPFTPGCDTAASRR